MAMFSSPNNRALSQRSICRLSPATVRAMAFHWYGELPTQNTAISVCSAFLVLPVFAPSALISLTSSAY